LAPLSLTLYRGVMSALSPLARPLLRRRALRGKEDGARLEERLGHASLARPDGGLVWIHSISVGESQSVLPLIHRLAAARPDLTLLSTSGTVTSAELLARRLPDGAIHQYAPLDTPAAARAFLDHWKPDLALFVESEIWPNLILGARDRGARLALISARITEKTAAGWAMAEAGVREVLSAFDLVLPQDEASAERLGRFGASVRGRLNLKLAGEALPCDEDERRRLTAAIGERPVVLAASTHPGEESIIATAAEAAIREATPGALLIIAPRHPERGEAVVRAIGDGYGPVALRSRGDLVTPQTAIYVADTLGELGLFFRLADVAVMGGSFVPDIGGHNPMEPARLGCPVISGPSVFNAEELYAAMTEQGRGAVVVEGPGGLTMALHGLLSDPDSARALGLAGQAFAEAQSAALEAAWLQVKGLLP
jgi:3-deoxy-D-manno-octulosonic-acid transferase